MVRVYKIPQRRKNILNNITINSKIIYANVIFFITSFILLSIFGETFWNYIAIKPSNILGGKYLWTFLTSMFMHAGLFHIFANMFSLLFIGSLVEKIIGAKRYIYFYLTSGLFAGLFFVLSSLVFKNNLDIFAVGASGALFGLIGFLMIITPNLPVYLMFIPIPIKMKYAAPGILIALWFISKAAGIPIGNTAHLGGLLTGLVYGLYLKKTYKNKTSYISRHFS